MNSKGMIYPELSYSIIGAAMDVHNELGPGWDEWDYHRAMIMALKQKGHDVLNHDRKELKFNDVVVDHFELDLLVDGLILLELKHLKSDFHPNNYTQIINYLKRWEKRLGILINFGQEKLRYQRIPYEEKTVDVELIDGWDCMSGICNFVHTAVRKILSSVGFGYSSSIFKKLLSVQLQTDGCDAEILFLNPLYGGEFMGERELDALLVEKELVVKMCVSSSASDLGRVRSYMKQGGVEEGVLIDLSHSGIRLIGVQL